MTVTDNPFETFDETGRTFFWGLVSGFIAMSCFAATAAVVLALVEVFAP